jgi:general secretion pathway protein D
VVGTTNQDAFDADQANLQINITPQINSDGMIGLNVKIEINEFTNRTDQTSGTQTKRMIDTNAIVANKEVLALGGLIRDRITNSETKVPILGDIPILGWFFKNKHKEVETTSLLVLISTRIIEPQSEKEIEVFSNEHITGYQNTITEMHTLYENRDPIYRMFFKDKEDRARQSPEGLIFTRHEKEKEQKVFEAEDKAQLKKITSDREDEKKTEKKSDSSTQEGQEGQESHEESAHNSLIKTIQNKQRTQLSLANFLKNKEVCT